LPFTETPLPGPAITLSAIFAVPLITLIPTASTPNPSQIDSLPSSEEFKINILSLADKDAPL